MGIVGGIGYGGRSSALLHSCRLRSRDTETMSYLVAGDTGWTA